MGGCDGGGLEFGQGGRESDYECLRPNMWVNVPASFEQPGNTFHGGGTFLLELKTINWGELYDKVRSEEAALRAVERRQCEILSEYIKLYEDKDKRTFHTRQGETRPLSRVIKQHKFRRLVIGDSGEIGKNVDDFIKMLVRVGARRMAGNLTVTLAKKAVSIMSRTALAKISCTSWKYKARMILDKSKYVGVLRRDFNKWKTSEGEDREDCYYF